MSLLLDDFCEGCVNKDLNATDPVCIMCKEGWTQRGSPPNYKTSSHNALTALKAYSTEAARKVSSPGGSTSYYQLPPGATELQDIISAKNMNSQMGEIGRAWMRYGTCPHSSRIRDLNKIIFYAEAELNRIAKYEGEQK